MRQVLVAALTVCAALGTCCTASAQRSFFNLTAEQVRVDSLLPVFTHRVPLGIHYADSTYSVNLLYPEFITMSEGDIRRYHAITDEPLPAMPVVKQAVSVDRKKGELVVSFVPLVCRDGQYQKLVSFQLAVEGRKKANVRRQAASDKRQASANSRYAEHSVLSTGRWIKIRVAQTGVHQLTSELVRQAGLTDLSKVKVYGYGGALQPEVLTGDYLTTTDDLQEVPTCEVGGKRLFWAQGPVTWDDRGRRIRNPYSNYGYYFLTENDEAPLTVDSETLMGDHYPAAVDYHSLYEVDDYAWYHGGRNLYDATTITASNSRNFTVTAKNTEGPATMTISVTGDAAMNVYVSMNGTPVDTLQIPSSGSYDRMRVSTSTTTLNEVQAQNTVTLSTDHASGTARLDYIDLKSEQPTAAPDLSSTAFPVPEYVYAITNQDHHADTAADMVIIISTNQQLRAQAERLKTLHEERDTMRVRIVPADELYNEFSSGTPDANAYRRYMKMLYDRAETDTDMPRYLLLMGDGAWDNRMLCAEWAANSPDDFLLCYESENSYSDTECYVSDDYFCLLDDEEGSSMLTGKADAAVGRIPARTAEEAAAMVDKIVSYVNNDNAGAWQNVLFFMGDDGNNNAHMKDADNVAKLVEEKYPSYMVKRVMWDAYTRQSSSTGNSYPDATRLIRQQMQQGALMMNYSGHGGPAAISHEYVLRLADFENTSARLPLWVTASCDIMPFDGQEENIGETALFNKKGGAVSFYGTTRTVYQNQNYLMNRAFTGYVLSKDNNGRMMPVGEAVRKAKNDLIEGNVVVGYRSDGTAITSADRSINKLQYTLLGDPAMRLAAPTLEMFVDSINNTALTEGTTLQLKAGSTVRVSGHVNNAGGTLHNSFDGTVTAIVRDAIDQVTCKLNNRSEADEAFVYYDRQNTVFNGSDLVKNGRFSFSFAVPKDISYSDSEGLINLYAVSNDKTEKASGVNSQLVLNGADAVGKDDMGPSIYCYLNSPSFTNGDKVNTTPYFVAEISDEDGINATGSGIGHDLQLIIDGNMATTYTLNDYFQYDFGSYTKGIVQYSIPAMSYGLHKLRFRAWDVLNNSTTAELTFEVAKGLEPNVFDINCLKNPARTSTTFVIQHDRVGSQMDVVLDIFDMSGRHLWTHSDSGVSTDDTYVVDWDLTVDGGRRLQTGVYLYRLRMSTDGSSYVSKAKKLIVLTNR